VLEETDIIEKEIINVEVEHGVFKDQKTGNVVNSKLLKSHSKTHEFKIVSMEDELATGLAINQYKKTAIKFLEDLDNYNNKADNVKAQIDISNKMFRNEDVVSTGVEVLVDFTISGFEFCNLEEESIKPLIDYFEQSVNKKVDQFSSYGLFPLLQEMAYEYFISGNMFPTERWEKVKIGEKEFEMPVDIKLMNPANIDLDESNLFGDGKIFFTPGSSSNKDSGTKIKDLLEDKSNKIFKNQLFTGTPFLGDINKGPRIEIKRDLISHLKRKARDYDIWGIPYLTKLAQAVTYKQKLWQLDLNTIDGLLNFVTIFKIGSPDVKSPFHIPSQSRLTEFKNLIKNPQASTLMVWPHDIDVITAGPDGKVLSFADKYKEANRAIIQGLGVPPILIDGSGTATAAFVTILALNKRLELVRQVLKKYVEYLIVKIATRNKLEGKLTGKESLEWFPSDLRDEAQIKTLLLAFYDRGLLPIKTTHNQGGYRHEDLVELKLKDEEEDLAELFARPNIPFSPNTQDPTSGRPSDTVDTTEDKENKEKTAGIKFAYSTDLIAQKYKEDIHRLFDNLEIDIMGLKKKAKSQMNDLVMITFTRMQQIATTFSDFPEKMNYIEFSKDLDLFHSNFITKLHEFVRNSLSKTITIHADEKELMVAGIFATAKKRADMFVVHSLKNVELMQLLISKKEEGFVGAEVQTPQDTACSFCKELHNEFLTLNEISKRIPVHPHQRFSFKFSKSNPIRKGTKKKKILIQDPKNKSKHL